MTSVAAAALGFPLLGGIFLFKNGREIRFSLMEFRTN